jgi:peroxiredoxin
MARAKEIEDLGISLYALSTDPLEEAKATVEKNGLSFPVLYGMDGPKTAEVLGAYYEERRNIIQPTNFIIGPDRKIISVTLSSGPVGRLSAEDVIRIVGFYKKQAAG